MEEAREYSVVSATKNYFQEELERINSIPENVLEELERLEILADLQEARADNVRARSKVLVLLFSVTTTILFVTVLTLAVRSSSSPLELDVSNTSEIMAILAALLVLLISFVNLLRNVTVGISSDREVIDREESSALAKKVEFGFLGLHFGVSVPSREEPTSTTNTIGLLDDAVLRASSGSWADPLLSAKNNLVAENERLSSRSRGNLGVGIAVAIVGVLYLLTVIFFPSLFPLPNVEGSMNWLPRLSLFFFIQLFAIFFLRLYVADERRIQSNTEEVTNLFMRIASGKLPNSANDAVHPLAEKLAVEDRRTHPSNSGSSKIDKNATGLVAEIVKLVRETK